MYRKVILYYTLVTSSFETFLKSKLEDWMAHRLGLLAALDWEGGIWTWGQSLFLHAIFLVLFETTFPEASFTKEGEWPVPAEKYPYS